MTELDKIALEVAHELWCAGVMYIGPGENTVTEFARRLVAKLSEWQEPLCYLREEWLNYEQSAEGMPGALPVFATPPLTSDTRTLDVLRQALEAFEAVITACKSEPAMQARKYIPLGVDVFNAKDNLRALITELEAGAAAPAVPDANNYHDAYRGAMERAYLAERRLNLATNEIRRLNDFEADAKRLALELECLILSCKDTAAVSKWWDSAHEALEQHRDMLAAAPQPAAIDAQKESTR